MSRQGINRLLDIYAGETALRTIRETGLTQDSFSMLFGASGGPKWFVLCGLDKYLMTHFFHDRTTPLTLTGSSVGSFRAACYAQKDPAAAIDRLARSYIETTYGSKYVSPREVTNSVRAIIDAMLEEDGANNIINNKVFKPHFIATHARGLAASENRLLQGLGLLKSAIVNKQSRSKLRQQYKRIVFHPADSCLVISDLYQIPTTNVALSTANVNDAILASGSLPIIMQGVNNIAHAPEGCYRDGGIVDYHFDFKARVSRARVCKSRVCKSSTESLILYPHFSAHLRAGWFDKNLSRRVHPEHYDRVVMLCPSEQFINNLPYGKIPDRSDFSKLGTEERMKFWWQATKQSEQLAEEFAHFVENPDWSRVRPIKELTHA